MEVTPPPLVTPTVAVSPSPKQILGVKIYSNGTILRGPDYKIYLIKNSKKLRLKTLADLLKYKNRSIINVDQQTLSQYSDYFPKPATLADIYKNGTLFRAGGNQVYILQFGALLPLKGPSELNKYVGRKIVKINTDVLVNELISS